jgi:protein required for attachment to host cells
MPNIHYGVLVADGGRARLFSYRSQERVLKLKNSFQSDSIHSPSRDLESDRSGRAFNVKGPGGHTKSPPGNKHDRAELDFAKSLAEQLSAALTKNEFDRIILIADPRTMGNIRQFINRPASSQVFAEVNLNLTSSSEASIEERLHRLVFPLSRSK